MARISLWSLGKRFIRLKHIKVFETVQKSNGKFISEEAPEYDNWFAQLHIQGPYLVLLVSFLDLLLDFCQFYEKGRVNIVSMFHFLKTDMREQKSMK